MLKKIILSILITSAICLSGCGNNSNVDTATPDSVSTIVTQSSNNTDSEDNQIEQTILDSGLKVDKDGNITDSEGKEIKSEDGKIKITTEDGKTVEVDTSQIEAVNTSSKAENKTNKTTSAATNSSSNKGAASSKVDTNKNNTSSSKNETSNANSSTSSNKNNSTLKPTSSSSASSTNKQESSKVEETKHNHSWVNVTKKIKVVDQEAYTYEEPVYEEQCRTICNDCEADITSNVASHMKNHILNDPNAYGSYRNDWIDVQVGTRTVEVPEQFHYEDKTIGRKCSSCGESEYY